MYDITKNEEEDGYNIVRKYVEYDYRVLEGIYKNIGNSATTELIKKFMKMRIRFLFGVLQKQIYERKGDE